METKANSLVVGIFVLVTLALAAVFSVWLSRAGSGGPKDEYFVVFNGSVQGLTQGSFVLFSGLRVGEVTELGINPGNTSEIRARISIDAMTPVRRDTHARLTYAGLTGVAAIELTGGTALAGDLVPGPDNMPPAIFAERSFVQNILESGSDTLNRINAAVGKIDGLITANESALTELVQNLRSSSRNFEVVSRKLADSQLVENMDGTLKTLREVGGDVSRFSNQGLRDLQGLIADGRKTLNSLDGAVRDINRNPQQFIFGRPAVPEYQGQ